MLIDGIAGMTISNGVLRVAVGRIDAKGETSTEDIFIPANCINNVVQALVQGVEELNTKLSDENKNDDDDIENVQVDNILFVKIFQNEIYKNIFHELPKQKIRVFVHRRVLDQFNRVRYPPLVCSRNAEEGLGFRIGTLPIGITQNVRSRNCIFHFCTH